MAVPPLSESPVLVAFGVLILYPGWAAAYRHNAKIRAICRSLGVPMLYSALEGRLVVPAASGNQMFRLTQASTSTGLRENLDSDVEEAARILGSGGVVVFPTDTLYGLGADAFSVPALERIFSIKGRPAELSLPLLVSCWDQLETVAVQIPQAARRLAQRFWPGPLTLVLPKAPELPIGVTGGKNTVALRMPDHPVALEIIRLLGRPITGTSANRSGQPDLLDYHSVEAELGRDVDYIVQSGPPPRGAPSTIVDLTTGAPTMLRQGALPMEEILRQFGQPPPADARPKQE